ncbi:hypothetical protein HYDPIDRAFT_26469, partial [Hydnomerulius pinastri MD-312]
MAAATTDEGDLHVSSVLQSITNGEHNLDESGALIAETQTFVAGKDGVNGTVVDATELAGKDVDGVIEASALHETSVDADSAITDVPAAAEEAGDEVPAQVLVDVVPEASDIPSTDSDKENLAQVDDIAVLANGASDKSEEEVVEVVASASADPVAAPENTIDATLTDAIEVPTDLEINAPIDEPQPTDAQEAPSPVFEAELTPQVAEEPLPTDDLSPSDSISPNSDSPSDAIEVALSGLSEATASSEEREETPVVEVMPVVTDDIIDDVSTVAVVDESVAVADEPQEIAAIETQGVSVEGEIPAGEDETVVPPIIEAEVVPEAETSPTDAEVLIEATGEVTDEPEAVVATDTVEEVAEEAVMTESVPVEETSANVVEEPVTAVGVPETTAEEETIEVPVAHEAPEATVEEVMIVEPRAETDAGEVVEEVAAEAPAEAVEAPVTEEALEATVEEEAITEPVAEEAAAAVEEVVTDAPAEEAVDVQ